MGSLHLIFPKAPSIPYETFDMKTSIKKPRSLLQRNLPDDIA